jgi:hypothetical protein
MSDPDPSWELYGTFLSVLETGSLSAAARALQVAQPTVRRRLEALEASLGAVLVGLAVLNYAVGTMPLLGTLFAAGGIFFTVLLAAALMGLVFLSSGSGHDFKIEDPTRPEEER